MGGKIHRNSLKPGYKLHWYEINTILGLGGYITGCTFHSCYGVIITDSLYFDKCIV